ncbi:uncharacterized protein LOC131299431 isoform X2 [Rhododendron vialii]|uniref:uncharacterized protein LOC131299431 isoform X2 n=1 Tax=Rhododendron vialii TaxID=182163 RepID=UPI00265E1DB6|nr:uncharacterized protein LOC131299431 isoform X2 [Rhododendron vialii]
MGKKSQQEELLKTLGDFTSKENWDKFFTIRGSDDSFEWYAEWPQLREPLLSHLTLSQSPPLPPQILVPGCGNSRLSEHLYDAGFTDITNIDFSKVVISDMLRRNVRSRPGMRWRVMDMTNVQFADETFDVVLDKGGLDALMEPELGPKLGSQYLSEVKRVLKSGGKFICLTLAESHVLGLLFPELRYGWKMSVHVIPQKRTDKPNLHTFMVIAEKQKSLVLLQISSAINQSSLDCLGNQACGLHEALESENRIRMEYSSGSDILHSLKDLQLGAEGNMAELSSGRRVQLTLGQQGASHFSYKAILLDAQQQSGPFSYDCGVFLVPKARAHEWLFSSEEGQWLVVESSKAARLIMTPATPMLAWMKFRRIFLLWLNRWHQEERALKLKSRIFMAASDGIKQRKIVHQVTSPLTGSIIVDDVIYEKVGDDFSYPLPSNDLIFRRLTFQRMEALVQSEALLTLGTSQKVLGDTEQKKARSSSKAKKRGNLKRNDPKVSVSDDLSEYLKVDHSYLASSYHTGIIAGFMLISSCLENASSTGKMVRAVVIGLGAGLLPMFLHACLPILCIEVVELDPVVLDLAKGYFGFREDKQLKVHITDGIQFVIGVANSKVDDGVIVNHGNEKAICNKDPTSSNGSCTVSDAGLKETNKIDILIVDVDSSDASSGLTCPASDFVEESFLCAVKNSLSEQGLFVINLVSRSSAIREMVVSRMKLAFTNLFHLQLEEDVNEVLFVVNTNVPIKNDGFHEASSQLEKLLKLEHPERIQSIIEATKKVKSL